MAKTLPFSLLLLVTILTECASASASARHRRQASAEHQGMQQVFITLRPQRQSEPEEFPTLSPDTAFIQEVDLTEPATDAGQVSPDAGQQTSGTGPTSPEVVQPGPSEQPLAPLPDQLSSAAGSIPDEAVQQQLALAGGLVPGAPGNPVAPGGGGALSPAELAMLQQFQQPVTLPPPITLPTPAPPPRQMMRNYYPYNPYAPPSDDMAYRNYQDFINQLDMLTNQRQQIRMRAPDPNAFKQLTHSKKIFDFHSHRG